MNQVNFEINQQEFKPGKRVKIAAGQDVEDQYSDDGGSDFESESSPSVTLIHETSIDQSASMNTTEEIEEDDSPEARDPDMYKEQFDRILKMKQGILEEDAKDRQAALARKAREEEQRLMDINLE